MNQKSQRMGIPKRFTQASSRSRVTTSNTLIGVATEAVAGGATDLIGRVRLNGAF